MLVGSSLSVIIANYNYEVYLAEAIQSALNIDWPQLEVIVIDDGSTDRSRDVIERFGTQIRVIYQDNHGQRVANNVGFAASMGDAILFLDADDVVQPSIAQEIFAVWSERVSKVQVQMTRIDASGRSLGLLLPASRSPLSPDAIRRWAARHGEYPSPPGSGNIYARSYLEAIFPIEEGRDTSTDTTCIAMAPFFGDVVYVPKPLVLYRTHEANDSNLMRDESRFAREIARAGKRLLASRDASAARGFSDQAPHALFEGEHVLQLRIASLRLRPDEHPLGQDTRRRAFADALMIPFRRSFEPLHRRILIAGWSILAVLLPERPARSLIRWRFQPRRPWRYRFQCPATAVAK